jgi:alpha-L-fucosidase 2
MSAESLLLRYTGPAEHFTSAAMVGNGRLGAVVFGHTHRERIVLNEDSCWAGGPRDRLNPRRAGALARVRELLFAGRHEEADTLAREHLLATPRTIDSYQPMGELALRMGWRAPVTE